MTEDQETGYLQLQVPLATAGLGGHFHPVHNCDVKDKGLQSCGHIHLQTHKSVGNCLLIAPSAKKTRNSVLIDPSGSFC